MFCTALGFSLTGQSKSINVTSIKAKPTTTSTNKIATNPNKAPLSGTDVVEIFVKKQDLGEWEIYYLKEVNVKTYRCSGR